jgi:hypothetical protein
MSSLTFAERVAAGNVGRAELTWLQRAFSAWLRCAGQIPMERCLGIPQTSRHLWRQQRDAALVRAHRLCPGNTPWKRSIELARLLKDAQTHIKPTWRYGASPPPGASELHAAILEAMHAAAKAERDNGAVAMPTSKERLHRIVTKYAREKSETINKNCS